jgi:hypothetical protein
MDEILSNMMEGDTLMEGRQPSIETIDNQL